MNPEELQSVKTDLIRLGVIPKSCPVEKVEIFIERCKLLDLEPYRSDLYMVTTYDPELGTNYNILASIAGLRLTAERLEPYQVLDKTYNEEIRQATCTIQRGEKVVKEVTLYSEYAPYALEGTMWKSKPGMMLLKTCEAMALRSAFPELYGIYTPEEFARNRDDVMKKNMNTALDGLVKKLKK